MINSEDRARLRELGTKIAETAFLPEQERNRALWRSINDLKPTRPLIHVRDCPLYMLEFEDELTPVIQDAFLRSIEQSLLLQIYEWNHLRCDRVIEPHIECPVVFSDTGFGIDGDKQAVIAAHKDQFRSSIHYEQRIFSVDDVEKIKTPTVTYDEEATMQRLELLTEIFDGILPVKLFGRSQFNCTPLDDIMTWTGIDQGMLFLGLEPEIMHRAAQRYIEAQIARIKQYEALGILSSNNAFKNVGNNCIGYTSLLPEPPQSGVGAKIHDIWGESCDQIMTCVSPEMSEEFSFAYEAKWAEQFPLYSYGCCEKLDNKLSPLMRYFPNLRKLSCSPYSNFESIVEQTENKSVVSFKPNSNYLALGSKPDMDYLEKEIKEACRLAEKYGANIVINMKTLITLQSEPWRLWKWCDMAKEVVEAHFGA